MAGISQEVTERFYTLLAVGLSARCLKWVMNVARDRRLDLSGGANGNGNRQHAEGWRSRLDRAHEEFGLGRGVGVEHDGDPREAGCGRFE